MTVSARRPPPHPAKSAVRTSVTGHLRLMVPITNRVTDTDDTAAILEETVCRSIAMRKDAPQRLWLVIRAGTGRGVPLSGKPISTLWSRVTYRTMAVWMRCPRRRVSSPGQRRKGGS